jgi:hypothetical protein
MVFCALLQRMGIFGAELRKTLARYAGGQGVSRGGDGLYAFYSAPDF